MSDQQPADQGKTDLRRPEDATVLVVDDEPDVLVYLSSVLEDAGLQVLTARDGDEALKLLASNRVDLVSLDLVMPRKSGIRCLMELRKNRDWSKIPVIFVTGHAHDPGVRRDVDDALAGSTMAGPSMYLEKPVTPPKYLAHVCKILGVECPGAEDDSAESADQLRQQASQLLENADPEALAAAIEELKRRKS